jgi:DNA polymerase V
MSPTFIPTSEPSQPDERGSSYESPLDLQRKLIPRPATTFLLVSDVQRDGVNPGDILVVDRSLRPSRDQLVVAEHEGELRLKQYPVAELWGVVTYAIRKTW